MENIKILNTCKLTWSFYVLGMLADSLLLSGEIKEQFEEESEDKHVLTEKTHCLCTEI